MTYNTVQYNACTYDVCITGSVVYWLGRWTRDSMVDSMVAGSIAGLHDLSILKTGDFINVRQERLVLSCLPVVRKTLTKASSSSMPNEDRSFQTLRIQVERGIPGGLLLLSSGRANRIQLASANSLIPATFKQSGWGMTVESVDSFL